MASLQNTLTVPCEVIYALAILPKNHFCVYIYSRKIKMAIHWDLSLIPGSGRFNRKGIGYPLQHSWAFLVAQLVKYPPAMWGIWVPSLGWEGPLEKGKASHSNILAWRIPYTVVHGVAKSRTRLSDFHFFIQSSVYQRSQELCKRQKTGNNPIVSQ